MAFLRFINFTDTHRLIPSKYSITGSVLETLSVSPEALSGLSELDAATNERKRVEIRGDQHIGPRELLYGVPYAQIVNAAFCHAHPNGGRFNTGERGAWYAGVELDTSMAEVMFHKRRFLENGEIEGENIYEYVDFLADFYGDFHHLDKNEARQYLSPGPVPQCYWASQDFAMRFLYEGSNGVVYKSVRQKSGTCIACFRPALVTRVRKAKGYRFSIDIRRPSFRVQTYKPA